MIHTSFSPNSTRKDILIVLSYIFFPWKWFVLRRGGNVKKLEELFKKYLNIRDAISFDSGRSSLYIVLKALGIKEGDEVLMQAYTCIVVSNAITYLGAKPVYIDIEKDSFNLDPDDFKKKITKKTKAVIIQNTFGDLANYDEILKIAKDKNLFVIEDCAHSLGAEYKNNKIGTLGDVAIFSFGRDKVISCVYGGMAVTNNQDLANKIREEQKRLIFQPRKVVLSHLMHPIIFGIALPCYNFLKLGKLIIYLAQKLKMISKALVFDEKIGKIPSFYPSKLPNSLAKIVLNQMNFLESFNEHRIKVAKFYLENLKNCNLVLPVLDKNKKNIFLRFTILTEKKDVLKKEARKNNIYLGDWYDTVIAPKDADIDSACYSRGSCQIAELKARMSVNLPTHYRITHEDAKKVVRIVKNVCLEL